MKHTRKSTCSKCSALCCKYFALEIDRPSTRNDFENIRWYISHQKTSVYIQAGKWFLNVKNRCKYLDGSHRCSIYEHRPAICRRLDANGWRAFALFALVAVPLFAGLQWLHHRMQARREAEKSHTPG